MSLGKEYLAEHAYERYNDNSNNNPICKYCGKPMQLDDKDFQFKGCCDYWWICDCGAGLTQKERYGKICKEEWSKEGRKK